MNRKYLFVFFAGMCLAGLSVTPGPARAGSEPFVGEIAWVPFNFAPTGWAFCDGQTLLISQNTALFSLLGTQYGGDGRSTFRLPDLQGRVVISTNYGEAPQLSTYSNGNSGGEDYHALTDDEIPVHTHTVKVSANPGTANSPVGTYLGAAASGNQYGDAPATTILPWALSPSGGDQPHNNMMPYVTLNCIIAMQGIFPPRP